MSLLVDQRLLERDVVAGCELSRLFKSEEGKGEYLVVFSDDSEDMSYAVQELETTTRWQHHSSDSPRPILDMATHLIVALTFCFHDNNHDNPISINTSFG